MMPKTRFFIFGQGRSGTTLLKQLINSHPVVICDGELLNIKDRYITNKYLLKVAYRLPVSYFNLRATYSKADIYGFTLLFHQCRNPEKIIRKMNASGWKIVLLDRENIFEQALSYLTAFKTNYWHRWNDQQKEVPKIFIPKDELAARLDSLSALKKKENAIMQQVDHLKLVYEKDLSANENWQKTANRVFDFLGVEHHTVKATLRKTYPLPYSGIISNYGELSGAFSSQS